MDAALATHRPVDCIVAHGISRLYGATVALKRIDVRFEAREVVTIEGHNGSGKSTLLGIIGSRIRPTTGSIRYEPGRGTLTSIRRQLGWVAHETFAYPDLTTEQNIRFAACLYGVDAEEAWQAQSARFGLTTFAKRPVRQQSRGQRQRVALARALVHSPSVLLLDEPTAGLDPEGVEQLCSVVTTEAAQGRLVLMVTHDRSLAARLATRRLHLERGRLVGDEGT